MTIARIELTDGNVRNGHIYLRQVRDMFPSDAIGGGNRASAGQPITVAFSPGDEIETDVAGDKMIFRNRRAVRDFFEQTGLIGGQAVDLEQVEPRRFIVRPAR